METKVIDLRSDTVTLPSLAMKEAMLRAPLGDDVFGEDPTVIELQKKVCELLGKEAALFVPSGTMGNLICAMTHCWGRGCEILAGDEYHCHIWEQGGIAQLGGIHHRTLKTLHDGTFCLKELRSKVRGDNVHWPITTLVWIENSHNGMIIPTDWLDELGKTCKELNLPIHLDGARLLNASVASGISAKQLARDASSVSICMSKGLGAPVGSVIAGSKEFIKKAARLRKCLGGGMRQAGVLAAAGIYGIDHATETFSNDHENAQRVAKAICGLKSSLVSVDLSKVHTNMLLVQLDVNKISLEDFCSRLTQVSSEEVKSIGKSVKVRILPMTETQVRLVFNNGVSTDDTELVVKKICFVVRDLEKRLL